MAASLAVFQNVKPRRSAAIKLNTKAGGEIRIVLLNEADSLALRKEGARRALFEKKQKPSTIQIKTELLQPAGAAREIPLSSGKSSIALAPNDADFSNAAVWKIKLPADWSAEHRLGLGGKPDSDTPGRCPALLRIRYVGDVARLTLNGRLIADNFYAGREFDLGLKRYAPEIFTGDLRLEILPLRKDAPIFLEPKARPDFGIKETLLELKSVEIVNGHNLELEN